MTRACMAFFLAGPCGRFRVSGKFGASHNCERGPSPGASSNTHEGTRGFNCRLQLEPVRHCFRRRSCTRAFSRTHQNPSRHWHASIRKRFSRPACRRSLEYVTRTVGGKRARSPACPCAARSSPCQGLLLFFRAVGVIRDNLLELGGQAQRARGLLATRIGRVGPIPSHRRACPSGVAPGAGSLGARAPGLRLAKLRAAPAGMNVLAAAQEGALVVACDGGR